MRFLTTKDLAWPRRSFNSDFMEDMFGDFDRIVNSLVQPTYAQTVGFQPSCEINESKDHFLVSFDMPGVKKEDIKIEVQGSQLMVSGERNREVREQDEQSSHRFERSYGRYQRTFTLPQTVNTEKIEAQYEDGVLTVAIPKAEAMKPRSIEVQSGRGGLLSKLLGSKKDESKEVKDVKTS